MNCLLFCTVMPIMTFFASFYFYIKHKVDKYNLVFNYFKKYESGGRIRSSVANFMCFNTVLYMLVIVSFFSYKFPDNNFYLTGTFFFLFWTLTYFFCLKFKNTQLM